MHVDIFFVNDDLARELLLRLGLKNNQVVEMGNKNKIKLKDIVQDGEYLQPLLMDKVSYKKNPVNFLRAVPYCFLGSRVRAELIE